MPSFSLTTAFGQNGTRALQRSCLVFGIISFFAIISGNNDGESSNANRQNGPSSEADLDFVLNGDGDVICSDDAINKDMVGDDNCLDTPVLDREPSKDECLEDASVDGSGVGDVPPPTEDDAGEPGVSNGASGLYSSVSKLESDAEYEKRLYGISGIGEDIELEYNDNFGVALNWMLYINSNEGLYHTVLHLEGAQGLEDYKNALDGNSALNNTADNWVQLENGCYYYAFNYYQLVALADAGISCSYVGTGEVLSPDFVFDDKNSIASFCEYYGDLYVAD